MTTAAHKPGDLVRIRTEASPLLNGLYAEVVRVQARKRGPRTKERRFDYLVDFGDGDSPRWFADEEVETTSQKDGGTLGSPLGR